MKITTWNVNSVRAREQRVLDWYKANKPDVLCLQETRCKDAVFPKSISSSLNCIHTDEPKSNGVAILSKHDMDDVDINPFSDDQHRCIAATINDYRIINVYVPQGQHTESPKYAYKLKWWKLFDKWVTRQKKYYGPHKTIIVGDFNICPTDNDVWSTKYWNSATVSCTPTERKMFAAFLKKHKYIDAIRSITDEPAFTWWGYMDWYKGPLKHGVRIDHVLHSSDIKAVKYAIDSEERSNAKGASDHAPVTVQF